MMEPVQNDKLKAYPPWRHAMERILDDCGREGYGKLYPHKTLKWLMDMQEPTTIAEYKMHEFDYLNSLDKLKNELLREHNICLDNEHGKGYRVKEPIEQVSEVADRQLRRAYQHLLKSALLLTHVDQKELDADTSELRMRKLQRTSFIQNAFKKREFTLAKPKRKQLDALKPEKSANAS